MKQRTSADCGQKQDTGDGTALNEGLDTHRPVTEALVRAAPTASTGSASKISEMLTSFMPKKIGNSPRQHNNAGPTDPMGSG